MASYREGLSFDDVLLIPAKTEVLPSEVDLGSQLLPGIRLSVPIISAPMDTVTSGIPRHRSEIQTRLQRFPPPPLGPAVAAASVASEPASTNDAICPEQQSTKWP